jgi:hypothetical protein
MPYFYEPPTVPLPWLIFLYGFMAVVVLSTGLIPALVGVVVGMQRASKERNR